VQQHAPPSTCNITHLAPPSTTDRQPTDNTPLTLPPIYYISFNAQIRSQKFTRTTTHAIQEQIHSPRIVTHNLEILLCTTIGKHCQDTIIVLGSGPLCSWSPCTQTHRTRERSAIQIDLSSGAFSWQNNPQFHLRCDTAPTHTPTKKRGNTNIRKRLADINNNPRPGTGGKLSPAPLHLVIITKRIHNQYTHTHSKLHYVIRINVAKHIHQSLNCWWKRITWSDYNPLYPQPHKGQDLPGQGRGRIQSYKQTI
jgi:hypothetical protein